MFVHREGYDEVNPRVSGRRRPRPRGYVRTLFRARTRVFETDFETDPEAAIAHLESERVDCVVSDYDMPDVNDLELLAAVRETHPDLPFVLFTGKGSEEIASEAIAAGVSGYLQKETNTDQYTVLASVVENAVEKYWAERALKEEQSFIESALDSLADIFYAVDTNYEFIRWNDTMCEVTGYDDEIADMRLIDLFPEAAAVEMDSIFAEGTGVFETDVHSKVLQKVVQRVYDNLSTLRGRKENGYGVGTLKWKAPGEYRSFTYSQSGFKLKNTSGRTRCGSRNSVISRSPSTATSPTTPKSRPSRSNRSRPGNGTLSSASRRSTTRPRNRRTPSGVSVLTWASSSTPTTPTEPPSNHSTCPTNGSGWNVHSVTSRASNTGLRIGRNSAESWPSVMLS